uniref:Tudor domain containing 7 a n=1 Tax=Fundulus heteroclitus TaxID=8078 RepID=A0A3Q2PHT1_FUNHE
SVLPMSQGPQTSSPTVPAYLLESSPCSCSCAGRHCKPSGNSTCGYAILVECLAAVCAETAHIAELIARQRSSKKSGRSQVVNCKMRYKPFNPYMLNVFPQSSLRQPSAGNYSNWTANRSGPRGGHRGCSASGDFRQLDQKLRLVTPVEHRVSSPPPAAKENIDLDPYDVALVQSRVKQLLERCPNGVWMSKLSDKYSDMFVQKLHPQALIDLDKWPHICMVEKACISNRGDQLIFPPLPSSSPASPVSSNNCSPVSRPNSTLSSPPSASNQLSKTPSPSCKTPSPSSKTPSPSCKTPSPSSKTRDSPRSPLASPTFIFPPQSGAAAASGKVLPSVTLRSPAPNPALAPRLPQGANHSVPAGEDCKSQTFPTFPPNRSAPLLAPTWTALASTNASSPSSSLQPDQDVLPLLKATFSSPSSSAPSPPSKPCPLVVSDEVRQKIKELLSKCSKGLWADALPRFFMDVYKTPFPEEILDNLCVLCDICTVEYPLPNNKKKAILYYSSEADMSPTNSEQTKTSPLPSGLDLLGPVIPPPLTRPQEHCPSVLVAEAKSTNALTIRYVGQNYSDAQEAMEDVMQTFYTKNSTSIPVCEPVVGQLVAVLGEDGDEVGRAQVMEVVNGNKVKVFYMDYGFSVETSRKCLLELHQDFLTLPFQATNVRLAGLEAFSCDPKVLSTLDKLAVGKILRMETLKPRQPNEMPTVVLYDTSEEDDVNVNSMCLKALQDNTMNNPLFVCAQTRIPVAATQKSALNRASNFFVTSESLVCRPFSGKLCLARYKDKWARAEITYMHDNRVMEILFIDLGVTATVTFTEVREIPQHVLKEYIIIPPQTVKCQLADLTVPEEGWSQEALSLLKETVLGAKELKMKISKVEKIKGDKVIFVYLFDVGDSQELHQSINHQLVKSELWQKVSAQNNNTLTYLTALVERWTLGNPVLNPLIKASSVPRGNVEDVALKSRREPLPLPPPLDLPQPGQNMDVFVPVACHPGYFIVQPWQDLHKLVVLMGEMVLYYNQNGNTSTTMHIQKGHIYAAKFNKNWHRVQLKGILANGLVSVYDLDYGEHELVPRTQIQPLIEEFRQLPFQALPAQLAGVTQRQWSEEASVLFRNHVEKRPLVAQVESVQDVPEAKGELRERKLTVYLVDTSSEKDVWIHSIMADIGDELSSAAEVSTQTVVE